MISLKRYLDAKDVAPAQQGKPADAKSLFPATLGALRGALEHFVSCGSQACPALGRDLKLQLDPLAAVLAAPSTVEQIAAVEAGVGTALEDWGRQTAQHYQQKTGEVKEILLLMTKAAEAVGERDQRCAQQITDVTAKLRTVANLDDLSQIRVAIEKSAVELKTSIDRMAAEGRAAIDQLRSEVTSYQTKLEEAEQIASSDALTGLRSRLCVEGHIERRIENNLAFTLAILDIDSFKLVNDQYGHLAGDELLQQFAGELRSACRSTDVIGRWGGDEFILLMDGSLDEAEAQSERLTRWVCGNYTLQEDGENPIRLELRASIGLAEHHQGESMKDLLARADALMYEQKANNRAKR